MHEPFQQFYSSLAGFRRYFKQGIPVLTYHKIGHRPPGAVFKALYISPDLFGKQMDELGAAGFASTSFGGIHSQENGSAHRIVITFDDGFRNVLENAMEPLARNKFHAVQFLVAGRLGRKNDWDMPGGEVQESLMDASQVREWLAAGHEIGAHTMTHPNLAEIPPEKAREEIFASRKSLEDTFGVPVRHFCYPYGALNEVVRDLVAEAGFQTACTTRHGLNTPETRPLEMKRWTARYPGRRPKEVLASLLDRVFN